MRLAVSGLRPIAFLQEQPMEDKTSRRVFLKTAGASSVGLSLLGCESIAKPEKAADAGARPVENPVRVKLTLNGKPTEIDLDSRATLLDTLNTKLALTGTKKGCDHGACGACTVHVNGERVLSCLTLAAQLDGAKVTTIEGLAPGGPDGELHPLQEEFIACDGFQCGYCTPGQIMSGAALIEEGHLGSDAQIREWMSGNLCRCGAYPNIVDAVRRCAARMGKTVGDKADLPLVGGGTHDGL
jgi:xanthine dehydrogenase YagT iron-sulfur-binding subunit